MIKTPISTRKLKAIILSFVVILSTMPIVASETSEQTIGIVYPVFTKAAYAENSFYDFYSCFQELQSCNITASRELLHTELPNSVIEPYMESSIPNEIDYQFITDLDVHNNNIDQFDTLIFFHSEYVTLQLYHNVVDFIQDGGKVVILSGNSFFAKIRYFDGNNSIQLLHDLHFFHEC